MSYSDVRRVYGIFDASVPVLLLSACSQCVCVCVCVCVTSPLSSRCSMTVEDGAKLYDVCPHVSDSVRWHGNS